MKKFITLPGLYVFRREERFEDRRVYNPDWVIVALDSIDKVQHSTAPVDDGKMSGTFKYIDVVEVYRHFGDGKGEVLITNSSFWEEFTEEVMGFREVWSLPNKEEPRDE